jgi:hypothetical protein
MVESQAFWQWTMMPDWDTDNCLWKKFFKKEIIKKMCTVEKIVVNDFFCPKIPFSTLFITILLRQFHF